MASIVNRSGEQVDIGGSSIAGTPVKTLIARFVEQLVIRGHTRQAVAKGFGKSIRWVDYCIEKANPPAPPLEK